MYKIYIFLLNIIALFSTVVYGFAMDVPDNPPNGYLIAKRLKTKSFHFGEFTDKSYYQPTIMNKITDRENSYNKWLDDTVVKYMLKKMERINDLGLQIQMEYLTKEKILDYITLYPIYVSNNSRVSIRRSIKILIPYSIHNKTHFIKFNLKTQQDLSLLSNIMYYTYTLGAIVDLSMDVLTPYAAPYQSLPSLGGSD